MVLMSGHQISRQTGRKTGKCGRGGGYKDNEYQVRLIAREATPDRDTHSTKANQQGLRAELGNLTSESGKNDPRVKDFQHQTQWPLAAMSAAIFVLAGRLFVFLLCHSPESGNPWPDAEV